MWGLEFTLFSVVMFFWMPASTWAGVNDASAPAFAAAFVLFGSFGSEIAAGVPGGSALASVRVVAASAVFTASGAASARAAAATRMKRLRVDDMAGRASVVIGKTG